MISITFIVPYSDMKDIVEEIFLEHPDRAVISQSIITKAVDEITDDDLKADIVIARGYSANRVKATGIPVMDITVTGFDITVALSSCIREFNPRKIAVVGPLNTVYGIEEIKNVFPCEIECYRVDDPDEICAAIDRAVAEGADAMIAGKTGTSACCERGIACKMIKSGRKTVRQAIDEAIRTVRLMRQERERSDRFKSVMDYSFEGILSVDHEGDIVIANNYARNVLEGLGPENGRVPVESVLPQIDVRSVLGGGDKILGELVRIGNLLYTFNCVPAGDAGVVVTFSNISKIQELEGQIRSKLHKKGLTAKYSFSDIVGAEPAILETIRTARKFSRVDSNIFIFGETGTGKELFAQSIHKASVRKDQPFIAINCAALAEDLLESELFGYVDGAFTGASKGGKIGLFELAHKGTVFLDEIGDISSKLQSRLLRVLQEREIMRIGHDRVIPIDIRIISASNKNLKELVLAGKFREDLFYRLNVLKLALPPLRERRRDILSLCEFFIASNRRKVGSKLAGLTPEAQRMVLDYAWPGNVRELSNFCERLCVLSDVAVADVEEVEYSLEQSNEQAERIPGVVDLSYLSSLSEREAIAAALENAANKKDAARRLGIDPSTLWRKMKKHGLA